MNETADPAILAEGLVKHYKGRDGTVEAVRGVDLEVSAGEVFGFLGPNGAGKSTTVRMLTTLLMITSGRAEVAGVDVASDPDGTRGLDPASRLTVWEELRRINAHATTIFRTTQYLEEAEQLCDRLAIIDGGLIVRDGTPAALKADLHARRGGDEEPTLDDVFLVATGRTRARAAGEVQEVTA